MTPLETALIAAVVSAVSAFISGMYQRNKPLVDAKAAKKMQAEIEHLLWARVKGELDDLARERDAALAQVKKTVRDLEEALLALEVALERAYSLELRLNQLGKRVEILEVENRELRQEINNN
jgi:hypothetical protein